MARDAGASAAFRWHADQCLGSRTATTFTSTSRHRTASTSKRSITPPWPARRGQRCRRAVDRVAGADCGDGCRRPCGRLAWQTRTLSVCTCTRRRCGATCSTIKRNRLVLEHDPLLLPGRGGAGDRTRRSLESSHPSLLYAHHGGRSIRDAGPATSVAERLPGGASSRSIPRRRLPTSDSCLPPYHFC